MKTHVSLALFIAVAVGQLAVPAWMIVDRELTLRQGDVFKFRTGPVDPYDPFRGRFVRLRIEDDYAPPVPGVELTHGQKVWAYLEQDEDGFARVARVLPAPSGEGPYIKTHVRSIREDRVSARIPVDRYYMREDLAPEAERLYRAGALEEGQPRDAYVTVRVRAGSAVLEELYIGGLSVPDLMQQALAETP